MLGGSATEFERDLPFGVWVDALDAYVASQELELAESWTAEQVRRARRRSSRPLRRAAPSRRRAVRRRAVPRPPGGSRMLLELLARDRPLVVVLDDLHWADEASIELLRALLRRGPEAPVLLALAFRPGQAPARLSAALATPRGTPDRARAARPRRRRASCSPDVEPRAAAAIYRHGGGNPFYLEQLRRAGEEGRLDAALDERRRRRRGRRCRCLPPSRRRWPRSSPPCPSTSSCCSRAAAVAGEPFEPDLAAAIAELPPSDGLEALDALLALDLVRPTPVPRRFVFRHPLVRRAVYESAPGRLAARGPRARGGGAGGARRAGRRARPPRRAVRRPGRRGGDRPAARRRSRRGGAGAGRGGALVRGGAAPAARAATNAPGRRARGARVVAARRRRARTLPCRAARGASSCLPADDVARRVELTAQLRRGRALARPSRGGASPPVTRLGGARRPHDAPRRRRSRSSSPWTASTSSTSSRRSRWAGVRSRRRARSAIVRWSPRPRQPSRLARDDGRARIERARSTGRRRETRVDGLSDAELAPRLEALYHLAWAETYLEHYEDAVAHAERGIAIARAFGEGRLLVPLMLAQELPVRDAGPSARGDRALRGGARGGAALGEPARALPRALRARLDAVLRRATSTARSRPTRRARASTRGWPAARSRTAAAARAGGSASPGSRRARSSAAGRCCSSSAARTSRARCPSSAASTGRASRSPSSPSATSTRPTATRAAPRRTRRSSRCSFRPRSPAGRGRRCCSRAASRSRRLASRTSPAEAAGSVGARPAGGVLARPRGARARGRGRAQRGDRGRCARPSRSSTRAARCACATRCAASCGGSERAPSRAGRPRRETAASTSLTKRELEIAGLVTDRLTNREIAAALFLSDKTIESHLRNIFHKLGVSSRVEVARAVERERPSPRARRRDVARAARRPRRRAPGGARLPAGARAPAAPLRQRGDGLRRRSRPSSGCTRSCSSALAVAGPAWVWVLPSRSPASACCSPSTPSWRRSSRSPAAPTSGAAG